VAADVRPRGANAPVAGRTAPGVGGRAGQARGDPWRQTGVGTPASGNAAGQPAAKDSSGNTARVRH